MKKVILISHVPCSSGTFITSYLAKCFSDNPWIVPETNPYVFKRYSKKDFLPSSPLFAMVINGLIPHDTWLLQYALQLTSIIHFWKTISDSNLLVIRDHCFSEFFEQDKFDTKIPIIAEILQKQSIDFIPIFTYRDPIDSWLGLNASFPKIAEQISLDIYSSRYLNTIEFWRSSMKEKLIELKIEDFAMNPGFSLDMIASRTGLPIQNCHYTLDKEELGSGASGRFFLTPTIPPRRPYSFSAMQNFRKTDNFIKLRENLGYPPISKQTFNNLLISLFHQMYQPLLSISIKNISLRRFASKLKMKIAYF